VEANDSLIWTRPILAATLAVVVAALAWMGTSLAFGNSVSPLETAIFALVFGGVYLGFNYYVGGGPCADC
jgi:hypothetical protein